MRSAILTMESPRAVAEEFRKNGSNFKDYLLTIKKGLRSYPSPDFFDRTEYARSEREILKTDPSISRWALKRRIKETLKHKRREFAQKMIVYVEDIIESFDLIESKEGIITKMQIPGMMKDGMFLHRTRIKKDISRIRTLLKSYLDYWKKIYRNQKFPLFSRYNSKYPVLFVDKIISEDQKMLDETWKLILGISNTNVHTLIRRNR